MILLKPPQTSVVSILVHGRDVNESSSFETETRPRPFETQTEPFFEMSQTVQPVKLLASNCYELCFVLFIYYAKHSSISATVLQKLSRYFPKDCQQFFLKTPLLYSPTLMHLYTVICSVGPAMRVMCYIL